MLRFGKIFLLTLFCVVSTMAQPKARLEPVGINSNGWFQLSISPPGSYVYSLDAAGDLNQWKTIFTMVGYEQFTNSSWPVVDTSSRGEKTRFYRVRTSAISSTNDWKNQIVYPGDPFLSPRTSFSDEEVLWIKFAIKTNEPHRVYFQDNKKYTFHYDFARARLPEFQAMTRAQFDQVSLRTNEQKIILGTVLYAPKAAMRQAAIQFVGLDAYPREKIAEWFEVVKAAIVSADELRVVYMPVFEQAQIAEANKEYFATKGIPVVSYAAWAPGDSCYSPGWALGTLKYIPSTEITAAYGDGRLLPTDILLTDGVPPELPYLAGILSLAPATPNSHVAILAKSYSVPFVHLATPELQAKAQNLLGKQVAVDTIGQYGGCEISLMDMGEVSQELRQQIMELKKPPVINLTPKALLGSYITNTESLYPPDIKYVGGKAANFGFIRRSLPTNSPQGMAITFDLWDEFMSQRMSSGRTLKQEIEARLSKYTNYPPEIGMVRGDLAEIRKLIENRSSFTQGQMDALTSALLARFDPNTKIRFRSSTNVEDSESFTGAGLYDSYSGCLADDLDDDVSGPSRCDETQLNERGVFRAIRRVYASFYNDNAFLERLRHGVDESKVGMAILVHYSSPDPTEMANGVATLRVQISPEMETQSGEMVTQKGAVSVTNPDGSAIPEVVTISRYMFRAESTYLNLVQRSSLVPLGGYVLNWGSDGLEYRQFASMFSSVAKAFHSYYPAKQDFTLDFEYKKIEPGRLLVKQVREIPQFGQQIPTFLFNEPGEWCVFQGEYGDVFANHRLKTKMQFTTRNMPMTQSNLAETIFEQIQMSYVDGGKIVVLEGVPSTWPGAAHTVDPLTDSWNAGEVLPRRFELMMELPTRVPMADLPIRRLSEGFLMLSAEYSNGQLGMNSFGEIDRNVLNESVRLVPCSRTNRSSMLVTRQVSLPEGVSIRSEFFWPEPPGGITAGYTAPLVAWKETTIRGLTREPIILRGYYSQTYRPQHHNFSEDFIFEPRLEEGIDPVVVEELEQKGIRQIYVHWDRFSEEETKVWYIGADGSLRSATGLSGK